MMTGLKSTHLSCQPSEMPVAVAKEYNLRHHHHTKHSNFKISYPEQSEARQRKIATLKSAYSHASGIITRTLTDQERVTCASLQAAWVLCRHNRPFTESEVLKECMITVLEELAPDKSMDRVIASVKQVPLSASTNARRVHVLAEQVQRAVIDGVKEAKYISLAIDESTDNTDISQLCVFDKINLTVTDGAPAMIGKNKGLVSRIKTVAPKTNALHCIIHQSVLCAKLSGELKEVMEKKI